MHCDRTVTELYTDHNNKSPSWFQLWMNTLLLIAARCLCDCDNASCSQARLHSPLSTSGCELLPGNQADSHPPPGSDLWPVSWPSDEKRRKKKGSCLNPAIKSLEETGRALWPRKGNAHLLGFVGWQRSSANGGTSARAWWIVQLNMWRLMDV